MDSLTRTLTRLQLMDFLEWLARNHFSPNNETFKLWKLEIEQPDLEFSKLTTPVTNPGDSKNLAILVKEYFRFSFYEGLEMRGSGLKGKILEEVQNILGSTN